MNPVLNIAIKAARQAGNLMMRAQERLSDIKVIEKSKNDYVTETDQQVEALLIESIRKAYPSHGILAEESGHAPGDDYLWIIDPIDGTRNFFHGFPQFCVSMALQIKGKLEHAVIYDPYRQEIFAASRGAGAHVNSRRIRVSKRANLNECLLGSGFPFRHSDAEKALYFEIVKTFMPHCGDFRRAGSAALDLAYVAAGRLDGFFELSLKPWDMAAGALMIKEAGGLVGDINGGENFLDSGHIVAGNPKIFKQMLQVIRPCLGNQA